MSIVDKPNMLAGQDWTMTSAALDLLQCFMSGLDDVIIRIALESACSNGFRRRSLRQCWRYRRGI